MGQLFGWEVQWGGGGLGLSLIWMLAGERKMSEGGGMVWWLWMGVVGGREGKKGKE